jgi:lipopolysaccharide transport system ATP-binding protein
MTDTVIRVENLSKKYILSHQETDNNRTLRDAIAGATSSLVQTFNPKAKLAASKHQLKEEFWALKDVSFEIQQGDRVGIIGRNGAGKSTLLKILSRIVEPTGGSIRIKGRVASLLEVGTGFHPELTGRENIFLNGAILGMSKAEIQRKFDEIVAFAEIEKFLDTPVKRYSSGMYVRLAFAVAAHLEPEILIVDEVLAVGDLNFQKKCLGKMGEIAQEGRTILFVSHSMGTVNALCDKAIFLEKGRVREVGTTTQITTSYMGDLFQNKIEDLAQLRLPGFGREVRFSDIQLVVGNYSSIVFGQPIIYSLTIEADKGADDLIIGSSIFNSSDVCVGSILTSETFSIRSGEEIELQLEVLNTNLAPGSYYAGFGIGQRGTEANIDAVIGKPAFQVLPVTENTEEQRLAKWQSTWGNIFFKDYRLSAKKDEREHSEKSFQEKIRY